MRQSLTIAIAVTALTCASQLASEAATNSVMSSVQDLGVTDGKPITNGFVFIDGKYLDPPYVVSRQGNGVYINGNLVEQPCPWPILEKAEPVSPAEDPKIPATITKDTSQYDRELMTYLGAKKAYYRAKYGEIEMVKMMVKVYQELPCVLKATSGQDENYISVTWANGSTMEHRLIMPKRKVTEWTRETIVATLDKDRANYENRLSKGDYYFLGSAQGRMTGTAEGAKTVLPVLLPILKTSKDAQEVQQRLQQAGLAMSWTRKRARHSLPTVPIPSNWRTGSKR